MATLIKTMGLRGLEGYVVNVQIKLLSGMSLVNIVGLADLAVKEARDRIESGIDHLGYDFPDMKIIISLAPSDIKKSGSYYDLPMLIGLLIESEQLIEMKIDYREVIFLGEVGLSGELYGFKGALPLVIEAKRNGYSKIVLPAECICEVNYVKGIEFIPCSKLDEVIKWLKTGEIQYSFLHNKNKAEINSEIVQDFNQVRGHKELYKYLLAAAAGGHNMLLIGPPGCGKSMIAKRMPTILPKLSEEEMLEVMSIYSICERITSKNIIKNRPYRAPHYNTSPNAIIGGGINAMPGEITLAHKGILFLDEFPEFSRKTIEALRQPLEDKIVTVSRVKQTNTFPADFLLIAAMNPCPCGYGGTDKCTCSTYDIKKYRQRISGPILDRLDIQKFLKPVDLFEENKENILSSKDLREKVVKARERQKIRFKDYKNINLNSQMDIQMIEKFCIMNDKTFNYFKNQVKLFKLSGRGIKKIQCLSRTFADLNEHETIEMEDVVSAFMSRDLD